MLLRKLVTSKRTRKKIEYEIIQLHKELGKYISKKYIDEDILDFTYDDKYLEYLEELKLILSSLKLFTLS